MKKNRLKKIKILEELPYSSMVSSGTEYLCIEQVSPKRFVLNIRHRETLHDLHYMHEEFIEKLIKEYGKEKYLEMEENGKVDELWEDFKIPDFIDGKKVIEIQDGQFLLGEELICFNKDSEIKFEKITQEVVQHIEEEIINGIYKLKDWNKEELISEIENYIND